MNSDRVNLVFVPLLRPFFASIARKRKNQFDAAPLVQGRVVFLGGSITEQGLWDAWLPEVPA